jgi:glycine/D-amino acid oxidase-like deaminating enzyme
MQACAAETQRSFTSLTASSLNSRLNLGLSIAATSFLEIDERAAATNLAARLEEVWPQLSRFRITHSWRGKVAMTFDKVVRIWARTKAFISPLAATAMALHS